MPYIPDPKFVSTILDELTAALPFVARYAVKGVPKSLKEPAMRLALTQVIPLALGAMAMSQGKDAVIPLTRNGALTETAKAGLVKRIAMALVPSEVHAITAALQAEVERLGEIGHSEAAWALRKEGAETVLVVKETSVVKASADTVVDVFFDSIAALRATKAAIGGWFSRS